jgi:Flp pilus assembly protein TadG
MKTGTRAARERHSRGQAMVEFALIAPIFFLLLFSVIQLGILFGGQNGLVASARELARYAAPYRVTSFTDASNVCADTRLRTQIDTFMRQSIPGYGAPNVQSRTITYSFNTNANGSYYAQLNVRVVYNHPLFVPLVGGLLDRFDGTPDNTFTLDATETMRIENLDLPATAPAGTYNTKTCTI